MTEEHPIARVFWPSHCRTSTPGYLIGWNIRAFIGCVACIVPTSEVTHPSELENALRQVAGDDSLQDIHGYCSGPPTILGLWNPQEDEVDEDSEGDNRSHGSLQDFVEAKKQTENLWLTMELRQPVRGQLLRRDKPHREEYQFYSAGNQRTRQKASGEMGNVPHLRELSCFGYQYMADSQIIFYRLPSPKHYFSCTALDLDIFQNRDNLPCEESGSPNQEELERTLHQVNCSLIIERELLQALRDGKENSGTNSNEQAPPTHPVHGHLADPSAIYSDIKSTFQSYRNTISVACLPIWYLLMSLSLVSIYAHSLQDRFLRSLPPTLLPILENSATVQQIRMRFTLARQLPWAWAGMHKKWRNHPRTRRFNVNFYNMFLAITIDTLLGIVVTLLITTYVDQVVYVINAGTQFFSEKVVVNAIKWLMGWPAGLKLNDNVDRFMGQLFLFYSAKWQEMLHVLPVSYHTFVFLACSTGVLGLSMMLSIISDILFICTLHINWFYNGSARIYMHQLEAMSGLWKLFRGKKKNVLRDRIDSCHYDIDQLLLGTIIFTVLFFLVPTVAIYYLYFSMVRFLVFIVHAALFGLLQLLNHFPVYGIFLYAADSSLFTGGIFFHVLGHSETTSSLSKQNSVYLRLKDQPSSVGCIFYYFRQWVSDFFKQNSIPKLIVCAFLGQPVQFAVHSYKYL